MSDGPELDRRNFLKSGAVTFASAAGLTAASEAASSLQGYSEDNDVLYGPHTEDSEPYDPSELSDDIDGLFLENSGDYMHNPVAHLENLRSRPQYRELIDEMAEREIPIYFGDVDLSTDAQVAETGLMAGEAGLGAGLAAYAGKGEDFTGTDGALAGIAGWLIQPFATYSAFMGSGGEVDHVEASNDMHPESFAMTRGLRNAVTAYKQNEMDGDFGTVWGSLHRGFGERLEQSSSSLRQEIEGYDEVWKNFVGNEDTVSTAVELQSQGGEWYVEEVHEFPELDEIV
ncbi:hypothetical protein ACK3SF_02630 [Candidatus Nanosalina sp. VS9-1]|uniref:hypothetical protein n=1 Tax=Candidatus Nanosalina sp. VS9-1 TaxID=3388566 RepID=UPI0039E122A7